MTNKVDAARAAILNAIGALDAVQGLLPSIRDDIERRWAMPNRHTKQSDVVVKTDAGQSQPWVTLETEPETGFVIMISLDMVAPGDVTLGESAMAQARQHLAEALAALDPAAPRERTLREAEESRRTATEANNDGLLKHLGMDPKKGPVQ